MSKKEEKVRNVEVSLRPRREFSEELKRKLVDEVHLRVHTVTEIMRLYGVSRPAIYRWIYKYTPGLVPGVKQVVQMESEAEKTRQLKQELLETQGALGRAAAKIELLEKIIELASEELGIDLKKSTRTGFSSGSDATAKRSGSR